MKGRRMIGVLLVGGSALFAHGLELTENGGLLTSAAFKACPEAVERALPGARVLSIDLQFADSGGESGMVTAIDSMDSTLPSSCRGDCSHERSELEDMLAAIQNKPAPTVSGFVSYGGTDFHMSRAGVLIHEECFEVYDRFDLESAVTAAVSQGFSCMLSLENYARRRYAAMSETEYFDGGAALHHHIPRLVGLFTPRESLSVASVNGIDAEDNLATWTLEDPCRDVQSLNFFQNVVINHSDCLFDVRVGQMPKLFCSADQGTEVVLEQRRAARNAVASQPVTAYPIITNWKGRTRIYNHPMVTFLPPSHGYDEAKFKSTLWHELLHNAGYEHDQAEFPDYSYFCQAHCFWEEDASRYLHKNTRIPMAAMCSKRSTNSAEDNSRARDIQRAMYPALRGCVPGLNCSDRS